MALSVSLVRKVNKFNIQISFNLMVYTTYIQQQYTARREISPFRWQRIQFIIFPVHTYTHTNNSHSSPYIFRWFEAFQWNNLFYLVWFLSPSSTTEWAIPIHSIPAWKHVYIMHGVIVQANSFVIWLLVTFTISVGLVNFRWLHVSRESSRWIWINNFF